jgi:acetylglutamate kinase
MSGPPTTVVKLGGTATDDEATLDEQLGDIVALAPRGRVIVHGGGAEIGRILERLGLPFRFVDGLRVTDGRAVGAVEMVLSGAVNKRIVGRLSALGGRAIGLSGRDMGLLRAEPKRHPTEDLGRVGRIERVDAELLRLLLSHGIIPVVSPISAGPDWEAFNVNADEAALAIGVALGCDDLVFVTDVPGVYVEGALKRRILTGEVEALVAAGQITGGMIPKLRSARDAVGAGVGRVHIMGWAGAGSLCRQLAGDAADGTSEEGLGTVVAAAG